MRIVFHVGMGKTGTSSIQRTLAAHEAELAAQNAHYLGMWFDAVAPRFRGHEGLHAFAAENPAALAGHAETFLQHLERLSKRTGAELFIHSNEGLFGHSVRIEPFLKALMDRTEVKILAYVRPPRDWLPSAFTQWNIHHKQQQGPIQPFRERARTLVSQYDGVAPWLDRYGEAFEIRRFDKALDIVTDFAAAVGLTLPPTGQRFLERREPAEVVMRALFNDRFEAPMLPDRFDKMVINTHRGFVKDLETVMEICFDYDDIDTIIEEKRATFEAIEQRTGLDLLTPEPGARTVDKAAVRERLLDYIVSITVEQSLRIHRLERRIAALEEK